MTLFYLLLGNGQIVEHYADSILDIPTDVGNSEVLAVGPSRENMEKARKMLLSEKEEAVGRSQNIQCDGCEKNFISVYHTDQNRNLCDQCSWWMETDTTKNILIESPKPKGV